MKIPTKKVERIKYEQLKRACEAWQRHYLTKCHIRMRGAKCRYFCLSKPGKSQKNKINMKQQETT